MTRIKHTEYRELRGITLLVQCIESLEYTGQWVQSAYHIRLAGKLIGSYFGWPTDKDLNRVLSVELRSK